MLRSLLATCFALAIGLPTAHAENEVKVLSSMDVLMGKYGMSWHTPQVRMLVKNLAYEKQVDVVFVDGNGGTTRAPAKYVQSLDSGYEIWEAWTNVAAGSSEYKFHVEYKALGQSFVDDQNGESYPLSSGPVFFDGQNVENLGRGRTIYGQSLYFVAGVRNIAYAKNVEVHYSYDNFATQKTLKLDFQPTYFYGYGVVQSPTNSGFEIWSGQLQDVPADVNLVRYYITYDVNGKRYADTNFGLNYIATR